MSIRVLSILAILATLCFAALITLQVVEIREYQAAPSVWSAAN